MSSSNFWRKVFLRRSHRRAGQRRLPRLRCLAAGFEMLETRHMLSVSLAFDNNQAYLPEFGGQAMVRASLSAPLLTNVVLAGFLGELWDRLYGIGYIHHHPGRKYQWHDHALRRQCADRR